MTPLCKECADSKNLKPIAGEFIVAEPCSDCGSFSGTQFTDFLISK